MTYHRHTKPVKADIGIIIVEIRDSSFLTLFTSVLSDIVTGGRTGNNPQVNGHFQGLKLSCRMHRHIVNSGNMTQGVERSQFHSYAH